MEQHRRLVREAVRALERQQYDLVFMDVQMPEVDGMAATREIVARRPRHSRPRIVAMTANAMVEDRRICIDAGMDDFISKPTTAGTLSAAIYRAIEAASAAAKGE